MDKNYNIESLSSTMFIYLKKTILDVSGDVL